MLNFNLCTLPQSIVQFIRLWLLKEPKTILLEIGYRYTERKKKRRVNFIPKFHSSLKKFVKYFTMITKRYMYGTKVPNFIGLWSTSLELLKFIGSYPPNLEIKIKLKINIGCAPPLAAVAALILLWIELTKALTVRIGMLFHSSINAFLSCARAAGDFGAS